MNNTRIFAGVIDFIIASFIQSFFMFVFIIKPFIIDQNTIEDIYLKQIIMTLSSLSYLIFRDVIGQQSIGKKIFKMKIIDSNTKQTASVWQRILRNITWFFGPIEVLLLLLTKERLGDKLAKTEIQYL